MPRVKRIWKNEVKSERNSAANMLGGREEKREEKNEGNDTKIYYLSEIH